MTTTTPMYDEETVDRLVDDTTWQADDRDYPWPHLDVPRPATPRSIAWVDAILHDLDERVDVG